MRKFQVLERGARLAKLREQLGYPDCFPVFTLFPYPHVMGWYETRKEARAEAKRLNTVVLSTGTMPTEPKA